jgi:acetyl-CoA carboxylase biotin carboxylase subunit
MEIPIYYDPMIGKLVAWGSTRHEAIDRLTRAIEEFRINGIETTLPFGKWAINHEAFVKGQFDTHFIANYYKPELLEQFSEEQKEIAALLAVNIFKEKTEQPKPLNMSTSKWKNRSNMR